MDLKQLKDFPPNFLWGAGISSFQAEGDWRKNGQGRSVIEYTRKEKNTTNFEAGVDFYHHYKEDIKLMKEMGLRAFRISISWTRIFPNGKGKVNRSGVEFYHSVINQLKENHIDPIVTMYHFDYPQALIDEYGGWLDRRSVIDYKNYASFLFNEFGDQVKYWITINEQDHVIKMPDRLGMINAGSYSDTEKEAYIANHNMCVASAEAFNLCHLLLPKAMIGPALSYQVYYPASDNPADVLAADDLSLINQNYLLDLQCRGEYGAVFTKYLVDRGIYPRFPESDLKILKQNCPDFIGVNYYSTDDVTYLASNGKFGKTKGLPIPSQENGVFKKEKNKVLKSTKWGWAIDSIGLRIALQRLYRDYNLPILITENGYSEIEKVSNVDGNETINDKDRIIYLKKHIQSVHEVISEGIPILGYCVWTFMDVISGHSGMNKRYGLVYVNREDSDLKDMKRIKKRSYFWYQKVIKCNTEEVEL